MEKKIKKVKAYSFECPKCGYLEYHNTYIHNVPKQRTCKFCGKIIKFTEHKIEIEVELELPEVGRMAKIVDNYGEVDIGYIHVGEKDVLLIGNRKEPTLHINIDSIKDWCYLTEVKREK